MRKVVEECRTPRPLGPRSGDYAVLCRYPLLRRTPNIRVRARVNSETRARNKGARRTREGWEKGAITDWYKGSNKEKSGKCRGKLTCAETEALAFSL
jgi:hypothetical protein